MGQYYKCINFDKHEIISPSSYNNGMKLMEFSWQRNDFVGTVDWLLRNDWKGDRVIFVGDYLDSAIDKDFIAQAAFLKDLAAEFKGADFYSYGWKEIKPAPHTEVSRYIYNRLAGEYVDLKEQPIQDAWIEDGEIGFMKIHPLSLLLAAGNGMGGGDYPGVAGQWVSCAGYIFPSDEMLPGYIKADYIFSKASSEYAHLFKEGCDINHVNFTIIEYECKAYPELKPYIDYLFLTDEEKEKILPSKVDCIKKKLTGEFESEKRRILRKKKEEVLELGLKYKTLNDFCAYLINNCEGMSEAEQDFLLNKPRALYDLTNAWLNTGMIYKPSIDWLNVEMKIRAEKGA